MKTTQHDERSARAEPTILSHNLAKLVYNTCDMLDLNDLKNCQRLIIYGGTFDPPHQAHIDLPQFTAGQVNADAIIYIPSGQPPHKTGQQITPAHHRLAMLTLALADQTNVAIDQFELEQQKISYTLHTLSHLRQVLGDQVDLRLLIGGDMAASFENWYQPKAILQIATPLIMLRGTDDRQSLLKHIAPEQRKKERQYWEQYLVECPLMDVSSTQVRQMLADNVYDEALKSMIAERVLNYIQTHRLYGYVAD